MKRKVKLFCVALSIMMLSTFVLAGCGKSEPKALDLTVAAVGQGYQGILDDELALNGGLKVFASDGDAVGRKGSADTEKLVGFKQYVYTSTLLPEKYYVCETTIEWAQDPVCRSDDWVALWWSDDAHKDRAYDQYDVATVFAESKDGEVIETEYEQKTDSLLNIAAFHLNLSKGTRNLKIVCRTVLTSTKDFDIQFRYVHRKNQWSPVRDFERLKGISNDWFYPGSVFVNVEA